MPTRRATRLWIVGILAIAIGAGLTAVVLRPSKGTAGKAQAAAFDVNTPLPALTQALRDSDGRALAAVFQKTVLPDNTAPKALTDAEAAEWVETLKAIRTGFLRFGSYGRSSAIVVAGRVLQRFSMDPAPAVWNPALAPSHDLMTAGLADTDLEVRVTSLVEIGKLWSWSPGRAITKTEEGLIEDWKNGLYQPVLRRLGDREPRARAAAVASLGRLPIDSAAAPAIAYLEDPASPDVRKQVLASFAARPLLLTEDAILKHMYDTGAGVAETAEIVLKTRGLSHEQVSLGSMIFHPKAEMRASVIPLLKDRTDVDPVVWLLQLSRDSEETVRIGAIEALSAKLSPEVGQRLAEMATTDKSPAVRRAASKYLPESQKTASLPPLPGSPSLNPKAN